MFAVHRSAQGAADWRSGPRWSIISVFCPVHPFATTWHFPSRGNKKIGGTGYCVTYDTDSQSRNVLASPLGEEGHEVAKGVQANWIHRGAPRPANPVRRHPAKSVCTRVRMIMILLFYVLSPFARGGRRLAVRTAMEHHIGALPRTPFPASRDFPSRGNEKMGGTGY